LCALVKLISDSILVGFKAGAGLTIAMTQLPSLLGVAGGGHNFIDGSSLLLGQLDQTHYVVLLVGVFAMGLLVLGEQLLPGKPVALGVVTLAIVAATILGLPLSLGVPTTGENPGGLTYPGRAGPQVTRPANLAAAMGWLAGGRRPVAISRAKMSSRTMPFRTMTVGTMALKPIVDSTGYIVNHYRQSEISGLDFRTAYISSHYGSERIV
jgi:hypothetical protein